MGQNDLLIMLISALIVGGVIYKNINNLGAKIDKEDNKTKDYSSFCDIIAQKIDELILIKDEPELKEFKSQIKYIQALNHIKPNDKKNNSTWEENLFEILSKLDEFVSKNMPDGEKLAEDLRQNLQIEFQKL